MIQTQENGKNHFGPDLGTLCPNSSRKKFLSKICLRQSLDIMATCHHLKYPILRKLSDGWMDRRMDGQTEEQNDFIGRCLNKAERPVTGENLWLR